MTAAVPDRAAVATTAILQTVRKGLLSWLDGDRPDTASIRIKIQTLLRTNSSMLRPIPSTRFVAKTDKPPASCRHETATAKEKSHGKTG
jgi:hypothetical protein